MIDVEQLEDGAKVLDEQEGLEPEYPRRNWRRQPSIPIPVFLRGIAQEIRRDLREVLMLRWKEQRAAEFVWDEIAKEFDGLDVREPELIERNQQVVEAIARTMPRDQSTEFNRLIVLMNACNIYLPLYITMVEQNTEQLYLRFMWLDTLIDSSLRVWRLAQLIPAGKRRQAEQAVAKSYPLAELPWDPEGHEHSWLNVAEGMESGIRLELVSLWEELRAIDIVLEEVAREFDGEDPLRPIMRGVVETTRKKLTDLHEVLSSRDPIELKEPGEEALHLARTYFENGKRLMNSL